MTEPRWALELLARRFASNWGRTHVVAFEGPTGYSRQDETVLVLRPQLVDELVPRLLAAGRVVRGDADADLPLDIADFEDDGTDPDVDVDDNADQRKETER